MLTLLALVTGCAILPPAQYDPHQLRGTARVLRRAHQGAGRWIRIDGQDLVVTTGSSREQGRQYGDLLRAELLEGVSNQPWFASIVHRGRVRTWMKRMEPSTLEELRGISDATGLDVETLMVRQADDRSREAWTSLGAFAVSSPDGRHWMGGLLAATEGATRPIWHLRHPGCLTMEEPGGFARPLIALSAGGTTLLTGATGALQPTWARDGKAQISVPAAPPAPFIGTRNGKSVGQMGPSSSPGTGVRAFTSNGLGHRTNQAIETLQTELKRKASWDRSRGWSILARAGREATGSAWWVDPMDLDQSRPRGAWLWNPESKILDIAFGRGGVPGGTAFEQIPLEKLWKTRQSPARSALRNVSKRVKHEQ